eukprot:365084-Chlamydomonas_euryale.AAC.9
MQFLSISGKESCLERGILPGACVLPSLALPVRPAGCTHKHVACRMLCARQAARRGSPHARSSCSPHPVHTSAAAARPTSRRRAPPRAAAR